MSGRVEQWLRGSERTPDRTVDERVAELLEGVRRGAQRNAGESWDAASERHAEEFIATLCARFPDRAFESRWPPAHDQPEKMLLQLWAVVWLVGRKIPTMIDNAYRHLNKADNLRSLRRARA